MDTTSPDSTPLDTTSPDTVPSDTAPLDDDQLRHLMAYHPNREARVKRLVQKAQQLLDWGRDGQVHSPVATSLEGHLTKFYLYVTFDCPFRCPFCFASGGERKSQELSAREFARITQEACDAGYRSVVVLGGEPYAYSEFDQLIEAYRAMDRKGTKLVLRTSFGFDLSHDELDAVCDAFDEIVVSIDGDQENHDRNRGQGVYQKATQNAIYCVGTGKCQISVASVLEESQFDGPAGRSVKEFCRQWGIQKLSMETPMPLGRARNPYTAHEQDRAEWRSRGHADIVPLFGCQIGSNLYCEPDGNVFPCYAWCDPQHRLGNLRVDSLRSILDEGTLLRLLNSGVDTNRKCRACEVRYLCGGMCKTFCTDRFDIDSGDFCCDLRKSQIEARLAEFGIQ